jgi:hypothetical protein
VLDGDVDACGACIERILDQLFHHGGRPLDHLASGNLIDQLFGKNADSAHDAFDLRPGSGFAAIPPHLPSEKPARVVAALHF